jgi:hypothetical protein
MQLAREIFLRNLDTMKKILDLGEYRMDKDSNSFKFYKRQVMKYTYNNLIALFEQLKDVGLVVKCKCNSNVKHGFNSECSICNGAGYMNIEPVKLTPENPNKKGGHKNG